MNSVKAIRDRRIDDRLQSYTLEVSLDGCQFRAIDWSLSGVLVADYYGTRRPGDEVAGTFQICTDMNSCSFKAVVVRRSLAAGRLALSFTDLGPKAVSVLEAFMAGRRSI